MADSKYYDKFPAVHIVDCDVNNSVCASQLVHTLLVTASHIE